nr:hypothetical protein [Legionella jordanis]
MHIVAMKISFKQRTIDHKIKVYDLLITHWVQMRNYIIHFSQESVSDKWVELDKIYGQSQTYIGEAFLVSDNQVLLTDINSFNEKFYRSSNWCKLSSEEINVRMEEL